MMFCQEEMEDLSAQIIEFRQLELMQRLFLIKKPLKGPLLQSDHSHPLLPLLPLLIYSTLGKESRFPTLLGRPTLYQTGNFGTAKTTCLSTTRTSLLSTLTREDRWLITKERRSTLCLLLTKRQLPISSKTTSLRTDFTATSISLQISSTLTISSLTPKLGSILSNGNTIPTLKVILLRTHQTPPLQMTCLMCTTNGSLSVTAQNLIINLQMKLARLSIGIKIGT